MASKFVKKISRFAGHKGSFFMWGAALRDPRLAGRKVSFFWLVFPSAIFLIFFGFWEIFGFSIRVTLFPKLTALLPDLCFANWMKELHKHGHFEFQFGSIYNRKTSESRCLTRRAPPIVWWKPKSETRRPRSTTYVGLSAPCWRLRLGPSTARGVASRATKWYSNRRRIQFWVEWSNREVSTRSRSWDFAIFVYSVSWLCKIQWSLCRHVTSWEYRHASLDIFPGVVFFKMK